MRVTIDFPDSLYERIEELAGSRGLTFDEVVVELVTRGIAQMAADGQSQTARGDRQ